MINLGLRRKAVAIYTNELKIKLINEVDEVGSISPVAKKHGIPASTIHNWIRSSGKKPVYKSAINNKSLKHENKRLKGKLQEAELELMILKDLLKKSYNP